MAWQTPKTDWKIQPVDENGRYNGDWFNIADYNRITGNIEALHDLAQELYSDFPSSICRRKRYLISLTLPSSTILKTTLTLL